MRGLVSNASDRATVPETRMKTPEEVILSLLFDRIKSIRADSFKFGQVDSDHPCRDKIATCFF